MMKNKLFILLIIGLLSSCFNETILWDEKVISISQTSEVGIYRIHTSNNHIFYDTSNSYKIGDTIRFCK